MLNHEMGADITFVPRPEIPEFLCFPVIHHEPNTFDCYEVVVKPADVVYLSTCRDIRTLDVFAHVGVRKIDEPLRVSHETYLALRDILLRRPPEPFTAQRGPAPSDPPAAAS